ncbi:hypothetical protein [Telmatospirillum sp.]|uniref:hypothetical protein n=1 Tax=Telmatospirillum sp. TaxID=2079197 RepID=UPI00284842BD|nr:hypothetical protein [Telmatospirillum sp.]MDR3438634.1 hypothetical protein [Telmatospirillum sp.]
MSRFVAPGMLFLSCLLLSDAGNATTLNELKVGVRVFDFLKSAPHGPTPLAVIFDGRNGASVDDARAIVGWVNSGVSSIKATFVPSLFDVHQLDAAADYRIAIVADGTDASYELIRDYALRNLVLTVSSDLSCMRFGSCTVGIASTPRVEVVINREVATSCGIEFSEAFRMMVREY